MNAESSRAALIVSALWLSLSLAGCYVQGGGPGVVVAEPSVVVEPEVGIFGGWWDGGGARGYGARGGFSRGGRR